MSEYQWSGLDATLKKLEYHLPGLLVQGQEIEASRGCVLIPLPWLKKLVDLLDRNEAKEVHVAADLLGNPGCLEHEESRPAAAVQKYVQKYVRKKHHG